MNEFENVANENNVTVTLGAIPEITIKVSPETMVEKGISRREKCLFV